MQNVAISAAAPVKSAQVVSDGKSALSSGPGFLQQLLGAITGEPNQQASNPTPAEMPGSVPEAEVELPEEIQAAAMSGAFAMLLAMPAQSFTPNETEAPGETSAPAEGVTLTVSPEPASGGGQAVGSSAVLDLQGKPSDKPEERTAPQQAEPVATGAADGFSQPVSAESLINASSITETDTPAPVPVIRKPTVVVSSKPGDKLMKSQVDEIVAHLWRQSLLARQQTARPLQATEPVTATEPEQALSHESRSQVIPFSQTDVLTVLNKSAVETAPEDAITATAEKTSPERATLSLAGNAREEDEGMPGEHPSTFGSLKIRQDNRTVSTKPTAEFADSLKSSLEIPVTQVGQLPEEQAPPENDLAGLSGLKESTRGLDPFKQQLNSPASSPKAWPAPHEQVLRGLEIGIKQLQASRVGERTTVKLQLFPEELGEVRVQLELVGRTVTAQFEASSTATANLLKDGLPALRQALDAQGFSEVSLTAGFAGDFGQAREGREQAPRQQQHANYGKLQQVVLETGSQEAPPKQTNARLDYRM